MRAELENYHHRIEGSRAQIISLITELSVEALNWRPIEESKAHEMNSMAVMATHLAGAEHFWIAEVIGRRPTTRVRETEFVAEVDDATKLVTLLQKQAEVTQEVLAELTDADLGETRVNQDRKITIRWGLLHVVDHYGLHLGHMQITYQLWRDGKAFDAPRWFERLPNIE